MTNGSTDEISDDMLKFTKPHVVENHNNIGRQGQDYGALDTSAKQKILTHYIEIWKDKRSNMASKLFDKVERRLLREWAVLSLLFEGRISLGDLSLVEMLVSIDGEKDNEEGEFRFPRSVSGEVEPNLIQLVRTQYQAIQKMVQCVDEKITLGVNELLSIHTELLTPVEKESSWLSFCQGKIEHLPANPGGFRTSNALSPHWSLRTDLQSPEQPKNVKKEIENILTKVDQNGTTICPCWRAARVHHEIMRLSPFNSANPRVAQMLACLVLMKDGGVPVAISSEAWQQKACSNAMTAADEGKLVVLHDFFLELERRALEHWISVAIRFEEWDHHKHKLADRVGPARLESKYDVAVGMAHELLSKAEEAVKELKELLNERCVTEGSDKLKMKLQTNRKQHDGQSKDRHNKRIFKLCKLCNETHKANLKKCNDWLHINLETPSAGMPGQTYGGQVRRDLFLGIHGKGDSFNGDMAAVVGFYYRESGMPLLEAKGPYPLTNKHFEFSHKDVNLACVNEFRNWFANALSVFMTCDFPPQLIDRDQERTQKMLAGMGCPHPLLEPKRSSLKQKLCPDSTEADDQNT